MIVRETHRVPESVSGARLSDYARTIFESLPSRKGLAKAIKRGELWINGSAARSGDWIETGQRIDLMDLQQRVPKTFPLALEIVFEDEYCAVINKPAGFEVSGNQFKTIQNALPGSLTPSRLPDALPWPRPAHRLDYSTRGLLLISKTAGAALALGQSFENRHVHKRYRAVVMGKVSGAGSVKVPINGARALSEYAPVESVPSLRGGELTLVDLFPITGRTHQLRIHMAAIGHPIVGDLKYGVPGNSLKGKGLFLAAVELHFPHPATGEKTTCAIDTPRKFAALLEREQRRWKRVHP